MRKVAFVVAVLSACSSAAPPSTVAGDLAGLSKCEALSLDQAAKCLADTLGPKKLAELRVDRNYDPLVYRAISKAWRLDHEGSPLSRALKDEGIYHPGFSPAFIITKAKADQVGSRVQIAEFRQVVAQVRVQENTWPPNPKGMTPAPISQCSKFPREADARAACFTDASGRAVIFVDRKPQENLSAH